MLKAVIFDMDGVIIDSEPLHAKAAILALKNYNIDISMDYIMDFVGTSNYSMCQTLIQDFNINATPKELLGANNAMKAYLINKEGYTVIPHIIDLIKDLHSHNIKLIIASSSSADAIAEVMNSFHIKEYFNGYVSGMMVANPKPAPDIFLAAARSLGVMPQECIVIEDSFHGVTAAEAADITSIGFINPGSGKQDLSKAAILVEGFDEIDYSFVHKVYQYAHLEPVTIVTSEHCIVRELRVSDIDALYQIYQTLDTSKFLNGSFDSLEVERQKHKAYIKNMYQYYGFGLWGVFSREDDRLIGRCGIEYKVIDGEEVYELSYVLDHNFQGRGLAKEFVTEVLNYCYKRLEIHRIIAVIQQENLRSIHLAELVGMNKIGECIRNKRYYYKYEITFLP